MADPTLGGVTLTKTSLISVDKQADIIPFPMPTEDSDKTEIFDFLGVIKTIKITGIFTGETSDIKTDIDAVEDLVNGNQTTIIFSSSETGDITVMVAKITTTWNIPGTTCDFEINLIQGTAI